MKWLIVIVAFILLLPVGCVVTNPPDTTRDAPVVKQFKQTAYDVRKKTNQIGQEGVAQIKNAGDKTGVNQTVTGLSRVVVDASEEIGQEQKGEVLGADVSLFPPQAENDGKVLRVKF